MKNLSFSIVLVLVLTVVSFGCKKDESAPQPETGIKVGQTAPDFELEDINSNTIKLSDYRGKLVIVDFWASWCHFCRDENPKLVSLYNTYGSKGLEIIGISVDENIDNWKSAVNDDGIEYIQIIDTNAFDSDIAKTYQLTSIPTIFMIDETGVVVDVTSDANTLEQYIQSRLK